MGAVMSQSMTPKTAARNHAAPRLEPEVADERHRYRQDDDEYKQGGNIRIFGLHGVVGTLLGQRHQGKRS